MSAGEAREYWERDAGPRWVAVAERIEAQFGPLGAAMLERAGIERGQRALDVGCGGGATTLELARRTGRSGRVVGLDLSATMLDCARERTARQGGDGAARIEWVEADAARPPFGTRTFDHVVSRLGVMFFDDAPSAFASLGGLLAPGGRLTFCCWAAREANPWATLPAAALDGLAELPPPAGEDEPGPFALARRERIEHLLAAGGLEAARIERLAGELLLGGPGSLDQAVDFALQIGPASAALGDGAGADRTAIAAAVREALRPFATGEGVRMPYGAWIVSARAPGVQ